MEDNADHDWSFVPKQVLDHRVSNTPRRKLVPDEEHPNKNKLVLDHILHFLITICVFFNSLVLRHAYFE